MRLLRVGDQDLRLDGRCLRIARLVAEHYEELANPADTIERLRQSSCRADLLTFVQMLPDTQPQYSYPMSWDNLAVLAVTTFDHWWSSQIDRKTRNMVRRAEKSGVVVKEIPFNDELVRGIKAVYDESPMRQGKPFWHYGKAIELVRAENGTFLDRSAFIGAYAEETLIGFAKIVWNQRRTQAGLMQMVSMIGRRDLAPSNALVAHAVRSCASREIPHLFYSRFAVGKRQRDSLSDFKEHNGLRRVDLPRYYVPLTTAGQMALRLKAHRGHAVEYLPDSLQAALRAVRDAWVSRGRKVVR